MPRRKRKLKLSVQARVEIETHTMRDSGEEVLDVRVYRTDRDHPHSLMFSLYYGEDARASDHIFVFLYCPIRRALKALWDKAFGSPTKRRT